MLTITLTLTLTLTLSLTLALTLTLALALALTLTLTLTLVQACAVPLLSRLGLRKLLRNLVLHSIGKATMVISNVPGPQQQRTLCGETLSSMQYFLFSPVGAYIGVCSYAGSVAAGASLERALEPEPAKLMMHWKPSAYELLAACEREGAGAGRRAS